MKDQTAFLPIKKIVEFCKKHHISSLALFGSILTSNFESASDVDFLVNFERQHVPTLFDVVDMERELTAIIGRKADLRTANDLSPYFRDTVVSQARVIYGTS